MDLVNDPLFQQGNEHKVFLSYTRRGKDTEDSLFRSLLYSSLSKAGISVSKDRITLIEQWQRIIEGSKVIIIIFSKNYAISKRCLKEFTKIMEFRKAYDQVVLPIFYGVDRSEVQVCNQESSIEGAFQCLIQRISLTKDKVSRWTTALNKAGGLHGFLVPNFESNNENEDIQNIVKHVCHILARKVSFDTDELVGVHSQVKEVIKMLQECESKDFVSIGIWGMVGIGKTTVARLVFYYIKYEFEYTCFLSIVMKEWKREGKVCIQRQLLSAIWEATDMKIDNIKSVSLELKERLHNKKVLIVLDDVNHLEQLQALCASHEWFGKGSRLIITTRDLSLLNDFKVDDVHSMKLLNDDASLKLFERIAFKHASDGPEEKFKEISKKVVAHAEGLPLALEDLGSVFQGQPLTKWELMLMKLSVSPPRHTYNKLKCSFDSLEGKEKEIFLNIVFFYIGEDKDDVIKKLDSRGYNAEVGIKVLADQSYMTVDSNKIRIHNMMQLTGRQIIRQIPQNDYLPKRGEQYDVFLSFRGQDTRKIFTSHLHGGLEDAGINVFKDDVKLPRGEHIKTKLLQAIRSSKISIIIFSKDYAGSDWCLEELYIIMECCRSNNQVVLPVFYHVKPSEVRDHAGSFGEAFDRLVNQINPPHAQVSMWTRALREAGDKAGYPVSSLSDDEDKIVKTIVEDVSQRLADEKDLPVADHPVGVDHRMKEVKTVLQNHQSEDGTLVGIWGMGGVGKTAIAKAIYNEIGPTFQRRSYLSKIRENWNKEDDKMRLQSQLLRDICPTRKTIINNTESGKTLLRNILGCKKVLVILDDVDKPEQVSDLVGSPNWCGGGSTIIITSRNKKLLTDMRFHVYLMKNLDDEESIEHFSWHAFKKASPREGFTEISRDVVAYSGRLPLALKELGSHFHGRSLPLWKALLEKLKKNPYDNIQKELRKSFDGSIDDSEKKIFLDISCFFIGMDKDDVTDILNGCEFYADIGMDILEEQSLLTIDEKRKVGMHNLLRDMGREIIRKESEQLWERSRLWFYEDARTVLSKHKGKIKNIEGLSMDLPENLSEKDNKKIQTVAFKKMEKLRLLHLANVKLEGRHDYISEDLRWLCWPGFPLENIPECLYQTKLVVIDLQYSKLKQVRMKTQELKQLKILNLSYSRGLLETPDFSYLPNLKKLILKGCQSLSGIHASIGSLTQLVLLDLEDCVGLRRLPQSIYNLKCLKTLILFGCKNIENLEEIKEKMNVLTTLVTPIIKQEFSNVTSTFEDCFAGSLAFSLS